MSCPEYSAGLPRSDSVVSHQEPLVQGHYIESPAQGNNLTSMLVHLRFLERMPDVKSRACCALRLVLACAPKETAKPGAETPAAVRVSTVEGFSTPESVLWDAEQQVWFVSNINGSPGAHDSNGFISRLDRDGKLDRIHFVQGGRDAALLNAPKGMAIAGDTLWVADIDALRGFNRRTGAPVATVEFGAQAHFLNDVALGPDGTIYVTDTGISFDDKGAVSHPGPDRIFAVRGRGISVAAEGAWLAGPNGITWDQANARFIVVPFLGKELLGWKPGAATADTIGAGPGQQDGVEVVGGETLVTSWADSTVFVPAAGGNRKIAWGVASPADIGVDLTRELLAIPLFTLNKVEIWRLR
jgi:sugar lactone lactonase YvrE